MKVAERALIGMKIPGYFPTPENLADEVVAKAELKPGMKVLEPSAGSGSLAEAIIRAEPGVDLKVIERNSTLRDLLAAKGFSLVDHDFLEHHERYDAIIQNPPFEDNQDIDHVRHAYGLLTPGGVMVSIMSNGPFFRNGRKESEFRDWIDQIGAIWEENPDGAFLKSSRPTGVRTVTVVAHAPTAEPDFFPFKTVSTEPPDDDSTVKAGPLSLNRSDRSSASYDNKRARRSPPPSRSKVAART
ncbi:methyltransferase [Nannocystis pusilla]|uniref:methyltransferase n=1 Tax=Nannocystis pusilla TaxID=889268 RepID=UPI003B78FF38